MNDQDNLCSTGQVIQEKEKSIQALKSISFISSNSDVSFSFALDTKKKPLTKTVDTFWLGILDNF